MSSTETLLTLKKIKIFTPFSNINPFRRQTLNLSFLYKHSKDTSPLLRWVQKNKVRWRLTFHWWLFYRGDKNWVKIGITLRTPTPPISYITLSYALHSLNLICHNWYGPSPAPALATLAPLNSDFTALLAFCITPLTAIYWCQCFCRCTNLKAARGSACLKRIPPTTFWNTHVDLWPLIGLLYLTQLSEEPAGGNC